MLKVCQRNAAKAGPHSIKFHIIISHREGRMFKMNAFKRFTKTILIVLLALGLLGSSVPGALAAQDTCDQYYTVQRGDYLVKIAREFGVSWRYLAEINDLANPTRIYPGQRLCISMDGAVDEPELPDTGARGLVWADRVVEDRYATIEAQDLAANTRYTVLFSRYGVGVSGAIQVGRVTTDRNGDLRASFDIPSKLVDVRQITVRLLLGDRVVAQNWFYNATASGNTGGVDDDDRTGNDLVLRVIDVDEGDEVTVRGLNFPAYADFFVFMADRQAGSQRWIELGLFETREDGDFEETFDIPARLRNADQISIRFESRNGRQEVSTWFYNDNDRDQDTDDDDDEGVPSFPFLTAVEVVRNEEVTIRFTKLPAGVQYQVYMGEIGTQGEDGILVGTVRSAEGGTVEKTFDIPAGLRGDWAIAIRMEAPSRGPLAFAYNWFTNQTTR